MENQKFSNDTLEFRQIVLKHIERILELSSHELRDMTYVINTNTHSEVIHKEDTRTSYLQSVEHLAYVLSPYFDDEINDIYKRCIKVMNAFNFQMKNLCKKRYENICKDYGKEELGDSELKKFNIEMRSIYAKKLFVALNMLLNRNDYLKSSIYGESKDDVIQDEENEE